MIFAALDEAARKGELILVDGGLCRFHRRRDGCVTIREVLVLPSRRRAGLGRALVALVRRLEPGRPLIARCPAWSEANAFWSALGFTAAACTDEVIEWHLPSSTAPTATPITPEPPSPPAGITA